MRTCKNGNSYDAANALFAWVILPRSEGVQRKRGTWHADRVLEYLKQREQDRVDDPFFIYLGFSHPHDTRDGTNELLEKYGSVNHEDQSLPLSNDRQPQLPVNYLPEHPFHHGHPSLRDEVAVKAVFGIGEILRRFEMN